MLPSNQPTYHLLPLEKKYALEKKEEKKTKSVVLSDIFNSLVQVEVHQHVQISGLQLIHNKNSQGIITEGIVHHSTEKHHTIISWLDGKK